VAALLDGTIAVIVGDMPPCSRITLTVIPPTPVTVVGGIFETDKYGFGLAHQSDLTGPWPWSSSGLTKMVWWRSSAQNTLVIDPEAPARQPTAVSHQSRAQRPPSTAVLRLTRRKQSCDRLLTEQLSQI
jgi:hypothetical protein